MSRSAKVRLIKVLDAIIILGVIVSVVLGLLVLKAQKENSDRNHSDTIAAVNELKKSEDFGNRVVICMLQVPVEQRTPDLEANCRKAVTNQQNSSNSTMPVSTSAPTIVPLSTGTSNDSGKNLSSPSSSPSSSAPASGNNNNNKAPEPAPSLGQSIMNVIRSVPKTIRDLL